MDRERAEYVGIEDGEGGGVDSEREPDGADYGEGETGRVSHAAKGVADVLAEGFEEAKSTSVAALVLCERDGTELAVRGAVGVGCAHAGALVLAGLHFEMKGEFVFELAFDATREESGAKTE
jgi:hypothetical protein